jgi:hypothetical protein
MKIYKLVVYDWLLQQLQQEILLRIQGAKCLGKTPSSQFVSQNRKISLGKPQL